MKPTQNVTKLHENFRSGREVTLRTIIRKLIEFGSTTRTGKCSTKYEEHSGHLVWYSFQKIRETDTKCNKII